MATPARNEFQSSLWELPPEGRFSHRHRTIRVLFLDCKPESVRVCLEELEKGQFEVGSDTAIDMGVCKELLLAQPYDVIIAEQPGQLSEKSQLRQLLQQTKLDIPIVLLTVSVAAESLVEVNAHDTCESVAWENVAQLPMTVRRALNEKNLRAELETAERALRHSQSLYRALADNPVHGICRSDASGKFIDVNQTLVKMLGYEDKQELLAASRALKIVLNLGNGRPLPESSELTARIEPIETEWKRKDGTLLKVRLSGLDAFDEQGHFNGCEIIVDDITDQRALEELLRHQASSDPLTGLANHRHLFEVLQNELSRSKRTGREFSILLLDLDGLKKINDQFGHLAGNRALCRLGQILRDCCRSIDTAARHGGDEFAVVLPETGIAAATLVARRICEMLEKDAEEPPLSVSLGIAGYPREADSIGALLYVADRALYAMKSLKPRLVRSNEASEFQLKNSFLEIAENRDSKQSFFTKRNCI
jgi:diguanylate cyclase (GGDEF)-like protein/PAS domain S-box-containing protein